MTTAVAQPGSPQKWHQVYQGDKECKLFKALSRGRDGNGNLLEWRTTTGLVKATKLTQAEVEAIIAKYLPTGIIQQHSKDPSKFRYWERASKKKSARGSISDTDKKRRIDESLQPAP